MPNKIERDLQWHCFRDKLIDRDALGNLPGWMMEGLTIYIDKMDKEQRRRVQEKNVVQGLLQRLMQASNIARFAGAEVVDNFENEKVTHIIVDTSLERGRGIRISR